MLRWHNLRRTNDNWKYLLKDRVLSKASSVDFKIKASIVRFKIQLSLCLKHSGYNGLNNKVKSQIRSVSLLASKCISSVYREMHWDCAAMPSIGRLFASFRRAAFGLATQIRQNQIETGTWNCWWETVPIEWCRTGQNSPRAERRHLFLELVLLLSTSIWRAPRLTFSLL